MALTLEGQEVNCCCVFGPSWKVYVNGLRGRRRISSKNEDVDENLGILFSQT